MPFVRSQMFTTPRDQRVYANLEGQQKKVDDQAGNDTDVNNIVARFARTGELPPATSQGQYCDVTNLQGDLAEIITKGKEAQAELDRLQEAHNASQAEQAKKDAEELARLRAAQSAHSDNDSTNVEKSVDS